MPLQATSGAASYDAFGGGVPVVPNYIEDVFSTYLYTGTAANQSITNNIDLSTNGGLVWIKSRVYGQNHNLYDTVRGVEKSVTSNGTGAQLTQTRSLTAFDTSGFSLGTDDIYGNINFSGVPYASWTFRKQPKFFDVQTFTGTGSTQNIAHNLGSTPGCIIVKCTSSSTGWAVYHRSMGATNYLTLNSTAASAADISLWNNTSPTSTQFTVGTDAWTNGTGSTYVAYLFAHDAGGFGLTGTDNVISCGSFTTDGSGNATVSLGYEPQWVLIKSSSNADGWQMVDTMRGMAVSNGLYNGDQVLQSQASSAETSGAFVQPSATGFDITYYSSSRTYIYIAIRRGPMKVPTSGTSVFNTLAHTGDAGGIEVTGVGFPPDLFISKWRNGSSGTQEGVFLDRLRGTGRTLFSNGTGIEDDNSYYIGALGQDGVKTTTAQNAIYNKTGDNNAWWFMKRAPSFFDEVCYTGTGSVQNITHNLTVKPQLIIYKKRSSSTAAWWFVYAEPLGATKNLTLDSTDAASIYTPTFNDTEPTSTVFTVGTYSGTNASAQTFVAYLFATCAGVSKVFSYTGNGSSQTINCGFTAGARFVLIKRTDSTGDWYVWDSARGIVSGNDPHLSLNSTAAEVTTDDTIDTDSTGFVVNQVSATNVNVSSATYIGIAIA